MGPHEIALVRSSFALVAPVGGALLDTLAAALGAGFNAEHRSAWAAFDRHVSHTMLAGACQPA